jgi:hypothetical protein
LIGAGVTAFIDLTEDNEGLLPYSHLLDAHKPKEVCHQRFPIRDVSVPHSKERTAVILNVIDHHIQYGRTGDPFAGPTHPYSAGNGSLMRLAPVPLFFASDPEKAVHMNAESSRTTHGMDVHYLSPTEESLKEAMDRFTLWLDRKLEEASANVDQTVDQKAKIENI